VIHQLPPTPETLWLRILGTGKVQKQALQELYQLPPDNPTRETTLELLYNLRAMLEARQNLDPKERELIMELSPLYLQRLQTVKEEGIQQGIQQGVQQGIQQGQRRLVESMLQVKFGAVDAELAQIIEALIEVPPLEQAQLILQLSREQLLARFSRDS
jgi:flagellar biosynthesis/type III secretory pathway protein FliH